MAQQYSTNLALSQLPEINERENPEIYGELIRLRNALKTLQSALDQYTGALGETNSAYWSQTSLYAFTRLQNISRVYINATENIAAGALVNIYNNAGVAAARNSNATDGTKQVRAYANRSVTTGNFGEFIILGLLPSATALTPGTMYYASTTPGAFTAAAPAAVGNLVQEIGIALSPNTIYFNPVLNTKIV